MLRSKYAKSKLAIYGGAKIRNSFLPPYRKLFGEKELQSVIKFLRIAGANDLISVIKVLMRIILLINFVIFKMVRDLLMPYLRAPQLSMLH